MVSKSWAVTLLKAVAKPQNTAQTKSSTIVRERASRAREPLPFHTPMSASTMTAAIVRSIHPTNLTNPSAVSTGMMMPSVDSRDPVINSANATFPDTAHPPCPAKFHMFAPAASTYRKNKLRSLNKLVPMYDHGSVFLTTRARHSTEGVYKRIRVLRRKGISFTDKPTWHKITIPPKKDICAPLLKGFKKSLSS